MPTYPFRHVISGGREAKRECLRERGRLFQDVPSVDGNITRRLDFSIGKEGRPWKMNRSGERSFSANMVPMGVYSPYPKEIL